jgi:hypothetical protein
VRAPAGDLELRLINAGPVLCVRLRIAARWELHVACIFGVRGGTGGVGGYRPLREPDDRAGRGFNRVDGLDVLVRQRRPVRERGQDERTDVVLSAFASVASAIASSANAAIMISGRRGKSQLALDARRVYRGWLMVKARTMALKAAFTQFLYVQDVSRRGQE